MLLLAMDTATPAVTVALHDGTRTLAGSVRVDARRHGELLLPGVHRVLAEAGRELTEVTALIVGTGPRVVYSLGEQRVWLVGAEDDAADGTAPGGGTVAHSHVVYPSPVRPEPGEYEVTWRAEATTGSDGVPITNVVVFTSVGDAVVGFSTAEDGSIPDPDGPERTGGIRQSAEDGEIMWSIATIGFPVVVVP
ncbi:tRNA threonylcarbamoyladenosine biosynthesis protein TsaB [Streptomyces calidiresistens]|uniref:Uncharacterized protein n=1 Tax=Streptomyces calidiresistens TaxID=1485586 RepID=A0A7W3T8J5_9ACTN|nr:hypothetical protein [Streptomyces calidiresistens]MBB0232646.1 hypothetical protein [Streptomyces calidiresistens]